MVSPPTCPRRPTRRPRASPGTWTAPGLTSSSTSRRSTAARTGASCSRTSTASARASSTGPTAPRSRPTLQATWPGTSPCNTFNQDGSSQPNMSTPFYLGYASHPTPTARDVFYTTLTGAADVYYTWDDVKNSSRNLIVYSGNVLDLDLLNWLDPTQVTIPDRFKELRDKGSAATQAIRGRDATKALQSSGDKATAECLEEAIKVGTVDTDTVGCIASKVVLYVSLVLILAVVLSRFLLALVFQWFVSKTYAAAKTSQTSNMRKRNRQIEDWSEVIYRAPPLMPGDIGG